MKVNFSETMKNLISGEEIMNGDKATTLAIVCVDALLTTLPNDQQMSGEQKLSDYRLGVKILDGGEIDLSVEEAARLKKRVGERYGTLIVGQAWPMLDGV